MRSRLSLLSTLALLTFTAIGCAGADSTDDADETVGQSALRIDSTRGQTSDDTSQGTATTSVDKIGFTAAKTPDDGATTDPGTDDGPAIAGGDKGDAATDQPASAPPRIDGVELSMDDGALTISIDAFDPNGLALSTSYSGFVVGDADGVTFTVSALDIALAAAADASPEIDVVIEDAAGEQADAAISLDLAALVEGSLGDSGLEAFASSTKGAP